MFGLPADTLKGQRAYRAKMVSNNTFNVVYAENAFSFKKVIFKIFILSLKFQIIFFCFLKIIMPQMALLCFSAFDEQNHFIGHRVLPVRLIFLLKSRLLTSINKITIIAIYRSLH